MQRLAAIALMGLLAIGVGCGRRGDPEEKAKEKAKKEGSLIAGYQSLTQPLKLQPGAEKTVIASGEGSTALGMYVYDKDGNCVAHDDAGNQATKDDLAVSLIATGEQGYTFEVVNLGRVDNVTRILVFSPAGNPKEQRP